MRRAGLALVTVLGLALGAGCEAVLGIEDPAQHLPRLDGNYLVAIERVRIDGTTRDVIPMTGTARLQDRTLNLSLNILPFGGGTPLSETSIAGIEFPDDSDEVEMTMGLAIPAGAFDPGNPPSAADLSISVPVRIIAEADFSFCAKAVDGQREVTLGSVLVDSFASLPAADTDCDDPLRP
ncbi:MAG: hypothetical protein HS111_10695 [Kofleriaceae bacterium]|nr:hypothetical protein [Kofleriaceae bacterium]MCL4223277.1 hypothetical protein [Myxococcales bacterium]